MTAVELSHALKTRDAAIAAAAAFAGFFVLLLSLPLIGIFHAQAHDRDVALRELASLRAEASMASAVRARVADARAQMDALPGSVQAKSVALAQSQLQQTLETIIRSSGGTVRSTQMMPSEKRNGFHKIAIQYDLAVPMSKLRDVTYTIESRTPYLFIDDVQISANTSARTSDAAAQDPSLDVRWTVSAYCRGAKA